MKFMVENLQRPVTKMIFCGKEIGELKNGWSVSSVEFDDASSIDEVSEMTLVIHKDNSFWARYVAEIEREELKAALERILGESLDF